MKVGNMVVVVVILCLSLGGSGVSSVPFRVNMLGMDFGARNETQTLKNSFSWTALGTEIPRTTPISYSIIQDDKLAKNQQKNDQRKFTMDWKTLFVGFSAAFAFLVILRCMYWILQNFWQHQAQVPVRQTSSQRTCAHLISNNGRYPRPRCEVFSLGSHQHLIPVQQLATTGPPITMNCSEDESPPYSEISLKIDDRPSKSETPPPPYSPSMNQQRLNVESD